MIDKGKSLGATLCNIASDETDHQRFLRMAKQELSDGVRIKFRLTPHGYPSKGITHWHLRHLKSNVLFIILGETGL